MTRKTHELRVTMLRGCGCSLGADAHGVVLTTLAVIHSKSSDALGMSPAPAAVWRAAADSSNFTASWVEVSPRETDLHRVLRPTARASSFWN